MILLHKAIKVVYKLRKRHSWGTLHKEGCPKRLVRHSHSKHYRQNIFVLSKIYIVIVLIIKSALADCYIPTHRLNIILGGAISAHIAIIFLVCGKIVLKTS